MFMIRKRSSAAQCETAPGREIRDSPDVIIVRSTYGTSITAIFLSDLEVISTWTRKTMTTSLLFSGRLLRFTGRLPAKHTLGPNHRRWKNLVFGQEPPYWNIPIKDFAFLLFPLPVTCSRMTWTTAFQGVSVSHLVNLTSCCHKRYFLGSPVDVRLSDFNQRRL